MMQVNKQILRDEIRWLLEAINEQYNVITEYEQKVPRIEFDIIMENLRKLYQDLNMLQRVDDPYYLIDTRPGTPTVKNVAKESTESPEPADKMKVTQAGKKVPEKKTKEIDLFSDDSSGFTEKLKEAREKTLGLKTKGDHSKDLKSVITINEKFLFINELFDGNLRDYNESVETLAKCSDRNTAAGFLDQMRKNNRWDSESVAFKKLNDLVLKRFE